MGWKEIVVAHFEITLWLSLEGIEESHEKPQSG
jgi:hypothetical protein